MLNSVIYDAVHVLPSESMKSCRVFSCMAISEHRPAFVLFLRPFTLHKFRIYTPSIAHLPPSFVASTQDAWTAVMSNVSLHNRRCSVVFLTSADRISRGFTPHTRLPKPRYSASSTKCARWHRGPESSCIAQTRRPSPRQGLRYVAKSATGHNGRLAGLRQQLPWREQVIQMCA